MDSCGGPQQALSPLPYVKDGHQKPGGSVGMMMGSAQIWLTAWSVFGSPCS